MPPVTAFILLLASLAGSYALAQDAGEADEQSTVAAAAEADDAEDDGDAGDDDAADDSPVIDLDDPEFADLDRQTYEEDDDDFVPTEEIPADEAIPFPSDI